MIYGKMRLAKKLYWDINLYRSSLDHNSRKGLLCKNKGEVPKIEIN